MYEIDFFLFFKAIKETIIAFQTEDVEYFEKNK